MAVRLRKAGLVGRTVVLKLRYGDFRTVTRSRTLAEPTDVARRIYDEASDALAELIGDGQRVRLIGVRAEHLRVSGSGMMLWDPDEEWRDAERTIDEVTAKFGKGAVRPATLVRRGERGGAGPRSAASAAGDASPADDGDAAAAAAGWGW